MNYAPQIIETIKESAVTHILVVDDAYDAPSLTTEDSGALIELLQAENFRESVSVELLSDKQVEGAIEAISEDELDAADVSDTVKALFTVYVESRSVAVDPGGFFSASKGATLDVLEPLVEMLRKCDDVAVQLLGLEGAIEAYREQHPDLIFMDFFLSPLSRGTGPETKGEKDGDRGRSIDTLKRMLGGHSGEKPAIVLMSSKDIHSRAERYRANLDGQVMGLRFGYFHKQWVTGSGKELKANGDAADVLVDTSGSLAFGRSLESAITDWRDGAFSALERIQKELYEFDLKDFAYLMRFRLYDEEEPFADYLEWFLGESLRSLVDEEVEWDTKHFQDLDNEVLTRTISGAHPFPSDKIARFFHRLRFNPHKTRNRKRFGLGDVFLSPDGKYVRMIVSPDCDLVVRDGKRAAARLLTVGGQVKALKDEGAFAGELVHLKTPKAIKKTPKAIKWLNKDLMTHAAGETDKLDVDGTIFTFLGRLRGLSAQAVQKATLADLSRVGVSVPPTVYVGAKVSCFIKSLDGTQVKRVELNNLPGATVQVFMPRGGKDAKKRILFTQKYTRAVLAHLETCDSDDFHRDHRDCYETVIKHGEELRQAMVSNGLELPGSLEKFGVSSSVGDPIRKPWLQFVCDLNDDSLLNMEAEDLNDPD